MGRPNSEIFLRIAEFLIQVSSDSGISIVLDEGYRPYAVSDDHGNAVDMRITVEAVSELVSTGVLEPLYSASLPEGRLWSVSRSKDGFRFHVYNPEEPGQLIQTAVSDDEFKHWRISVKTDGNSAISSVSPLQYPMGPLLMYYLTVEHPAIMIHGSGISDNGMARVFTGVSGKGKSTMAKLWFDQDAKVLNDDRLIIRKEGDGYVVYNTPMFYADRPRAARLYAIYLIHHASQNEKAELRGAKAVSAVAANCIQHGYDGRIVEHHLDFLTELVSSVPVFSLGFVPDPSVVQFIRDEESG